MKTNRMKTANPETTRFVSSFKSTIGLLALCALAFAGSTSWAQSIFDNPITGTNPNAANPYTTGQTVDANITVSGIGRGSGTTGVNANDRYTANGWNSASLDANDYFEWTLTPSSGKKINFVSLVYTGQASGTGPTSVALRSSLDGYAANIGTATITGTTISLSGASYQNITGSITFRLYGWGASASGGTFSVNSFTFNGTVANAVTTYTVTYNANGGTGSQTDSNSPYNSGATVTVLGAGSITRSGYTFAGWNTAAGGGGTSYSPGNTFAIAANTTLYAQWTPVYTVAYNGNGNTSGSAPTDSATYANGATVTVLANTGALTKTGYTFAGWNTASDGNGTDYAATGSATFTIGSASVTLYAKWTINTYTISYDGNGNDGGTAPVDGSSPYNYNSTVTVLGAGSLTKSGNAFSGWNTVANGSGTSYGAGNTFSITANTTLYAQWTAAPTITVSGTLSAVDTTYGTASPTPTSFSASGIFLTGDLTVTPPAGFEVSTSIGSGYATSLTLSPTSGTLSSTTVYVRLAATTAYGTYSGNVTVSGGGASSQTVATAASSVAKKGLTISGLTGDNKPYDGNTTATFAGTPAYVGLENGESFSVSGSATAAFVTKTAATGKTINVSGYTAPSANYSVTQPTLTGDITQLALTVTGATVTSKAFDGTTNATITGATLVGVISPDVVTVGGGGFFADTNAATGIAVTAALTLGGADAGNYSLVQPTGLTGDITQASQTITFAALPDKVNTNAPFTLGATASSGLAVTYASSTPSVATVSGNTVTIFGVGTTTITASQAGNGNYSAAVDVVRTLMVTAPVLGGWDVNGNTGANPLAPTTTGANLTVGSLTKGSGVTAGTAGNAWGGSAWNVASESLAISGSKFATATVKANTGSRVSFNAVSKLLYRTSGTGPANGALQYSLDGSTFTDITNTIIYTLNTSSGSVGAIDLSAVTALQNVSSSKTVTFRIVNWNASGSGGTWYVNNGNASGDDFVITGTVVPNQAPVASNLILGASLGDTITFQVIGGKNAPTDADGDSMTVTGVAAASSGTSGFTSTSVTYTADGSSGTNTFDYTVSDGSGGTDTKTVTVIVSPSVAGANIIPGSFSVSGNTVTVQALGIPGATYRLQYTDSLNPVNWQDVIGDDQVATTNGPMTLSHTDNGALPPSRYYRTKYVSGL